MMIVSTLGFRWVSLMQFLRLSENEEVVLQRKVMMMILISMLQAEHAANWKSLRLHYATFPMSLEIAAI